MVDYAKAYIRTVTIDVKWVYPHAALIFRQFNNRSSVCREWQWDFRTSWQKLIWLFWSPDRQLNQCASQARYLPTTEAGNVLPSDHCDRQWAPANEQHQHADHSGVWVQQRWYRPVLQRRSLCPTHRPQHGSPHRHPGLHCSTLRCV